MSQEADAAEFERRRKDAEEQAGAKTAKNRAKRQKKKDRSKGKGENVTESRGPAGSLDVPDAPIKKRRLVNGKELVFRRPGEDSDEEEEGDGPNLPGYAQEDATPSPSVVEMPRVLDERRITIHEDD